MAGLCCHSNEKWGALVDSIVVSLEWVLNQLFKYAANTSKGRRKYQLNFPAYFILVAISLVFNHFVLVGCCFFFVCLFFVEVYLSLYHKNLPIFALLRCSTLLKL